MTLRGKDWEDNELGGHKEQHGKAGSEVGEGEEKWTKCFVGF